MNFWTFMWKVLSCAGDRFSRTLDFIFDHKLKFGVPLGCCRDHSQGSPALLDGREWIARCVDGICSYAGAKQN